MDTNINNNIDLSVLDGLSEKEKELALKILKEYSLNGTSSELNNILLEDYNETPVDILTFVDDYNYLGNAWHDAEGNSKLYPYWRKELVKIFPDNITTTVNNGIFSGSRGRGKAQPLDALVFTKNGYKRMGDLHLGEEVYGDDGKLYPITGIFPQGKKQIVKLTFSDNTSTLCSDEHLWTVFDTKLNKEVTLTAKEIYENGIYKRILPNGWTEKRYSLPNIKPLEFEKKKHLISPYMLGCLLGDGCFSQTVGFTTQDDEIYNILNNELNLNNYEFKKHSLQENDISFYIKNKNHNSPKDKNIYWEEIKRLGLAKHTAKSKFIPKEYLYDSIDNRIELLQGLLDTDGECRTDGQISFRCISKELGNNIKWLIQSLGGLATNYKTIENKFYNYKNKKTNQIEKRQCADTYSIGVKIPKTFNPFKLSRKLDRLNQNRIIPKRRIINIEYLDKQECQCIYINSERHLYLTNDLIPTHNTEVATLIAAYLLHRILCLKDPVAYYHLKPTEKIVFAFMNIKLALAEEIGVAKFQNTLQSSPWFMAHGALEGRTKKLWVPQKFNNQEAVDIKIGSQADDLIGLPIFFCFCLDGDTLIKTSQGIQKISSLEGKEIQVYSIDKNGAEVLSDPCTVQVTGESSIEYEIELEDNTVIKCTPSHQFLLKDGTYKRADELTEDDELFDSKMYGYIYKTTNLINNKMYIGQHKADHFEFSNYKGSGKILQEAFNKYGKSNFKTELLKSDGKVPTICSSQDELNFAEEYYVDLYNCVNDCMFYNCVAGGGGTNVYASLSVEEKNQRNSKIKESLLKTFAQKDATYYKARAEKKAQTLAQLSESEQAKRRLIRVDAQKKAQANMTEEQKQLRSLHHKQSIAAQTPEEREQRKLKERATKDAKSAEEKLAYHQKLSIANKGRRKYTDGNHTIYVYPGQEPAGYVLGGGNLNKYKYRYFYNNQYYNGKQQLLDTLKVEFPNIKLSNIDSIIANTSQAKHKFPTLIGMISKEDREYEN